MKLFRSFARLAFTASAMYQFEYWMESLGNLVAMYGAYWLWNTLYGASPQLFTTSLDQMLTYAMLAVLLEVILQAANMPRYYITEQMRTGRIEMDLLKPLDFMFHLMASSAGELIFKLITQAVPGFLFGALLLGLRLPASPAYALLFLASLVLAFLVGFSLNYLIGLISFFTVGTHQISWVYYAVMRFFSGQIIPLWYFPAVLAQITALLPFQAIIGIPVSIYIGRLTITDALGALGMQAIWAAVLLGLGRLAWQQAYTRLTVQGG